MASLSDKIFFMMYGDQLLSASCMVTMDPKDVFKQISRIKIIRSWCEQKIGYKNIWSNNLCRAMKGETPAVLKKSTNFIKVRG